MTKCPRIYVTDRYWQNRVGWLQYIKEKTLYLVWQTLVIRQILYITDKTGKYYKSEEQGRMLTKIIKRDGREVAFDRVKIADAIYKAAQVLGGNDYEMAQDLAEKVETYVENTIQGRIPTVEEVQDAVEHTLIENGQ